MRERSSVTIPDSVCITSTRTTVFTGRKRAPSSAQWFPRLFEERDEVFTDLQSIENGEIRSLRFGCGTFVDPEALRAACEIHRRYLPDCLIHPSHADANQLMSEVLAGEIDAALVTLPVDDDQLQIDEIRHDRLVVCLRADDPLATNATLHPVHLAGRLAVLYHPQRHPAAHLRLLQMLAEKGVEIENQCRASRPSEMQRLVLEGYGLSLIGDGTALSPGLTTRPITGVTWTVDTAFIYHLEHYPKTMPVLAHELKRQLSLPAKKPIVKVAVASSNGVEPRPPRPKSIEARSPRPKIGVPEQLSLPGIMVQ